MKCRDCAYWRRHTEKHHWQSSKLCAGTCSSEKWVESSACPGDGVQYWDYESFSAGFETGEDFGCIHFK